METIQGNLKSLTNHTIMPTSGKNRMALKKADYFSKTEVECHMILYYLAYS